MLLVFADPVIYPPAQPYGLMILQRGLSERGISCKLVSPFYRSDPASFIRQVLAECKPRIVGYSFRNLDTAGFDFNADGSSSFIQDLLAVLPDRESYTGIVVIGGSGFSIAPTELMELTKADIGFAGPAEQDFAEFCDRVIKKGCTLVDAATGLRTAIGNRSPAKSDNARLGATGASSPEAIEIARVVGGTVPVRTKTGCSLRCAYCVVPSIEPLRLRGWADISQELKMWIEAGLGDRIFMADGEFNLPSVQRAIGIAQNMRQQFGNKISWRCYLEAGFITPELIESLRAANCIGISMTVDSLADEPRRGFAKRTSAERALEGIYCCLRSGIPTGINLLFGGPGETFDTARQTAEIARSLSDKGVTVAVTIGLRVYPNTPLQRISLTEEHRRFYESGLIYPWLGIYCSPARRSDLAQEILPILGNSPLIKYTQPPDRIEQSFFQRIASATVELVEGHPVTARAQFEKLASEFPERLEPKLGLLKCDLGSRTNGIPMK